MKVAIVGAGSLGLLWGARLAEKQYEPTFITRTKKQKEKLSQQGLTVITLSNQTKRFKVNAVWTEDSHLPVFDLILVTVKQLQLKKAVPLIQRCSHEQTIFLFFQNGMGHEETITQLQRRNKTYAAVTTEGALRKSFIEVQHTGKGETWIGSFPYKSEKSAESIQPFLQAFQQNEWIYYDPNIVQRMWEKLSINSVINPLTTIYRVKNGELLSGKYDKLIKGILSEVIEVAHVSGVQLDEQKIYQRVSNVCQQTAENQSSMLQDRLKGNRTEIDYINGFIVNLGKQLHISTPINDQLVQQIHQLEGL